MKKCRGIEIEPGVYSGCDALESGLTDCPTCEGMGVEIEERDLSIIAGRTDGFVITRHPNGNIMVRGEGVMEVLAKWGADLGQGKLHSLMSMIEEMWPEK